MSLPEFIGQSIAIFVKSMSTIQMIAYNLRMHSKGSQEGMTIWVYKMWKEEYRRVAKIGYYLKKTIKVITEGTSKYACRE